VGFVKILYKMTTGTIYDYFYFNCRCVCTVDNKGMASIIYLILFIIQQFNIEIIVIKNHKLYTY